MINKTDKHQRQKKFIEDYCDWAFNKFGFTPAYLRVKFEKDCKDDPKAAMTAHSDYPYRTYTITVYDSALDMNRESIIHSVHHELTHFILREMCYVRMTNDKDEWRCALEKAVDHIAYLIQFPQKNAKATNNNN